MCGGWTSRGCYDCLRVRAELLRGNAGEFGIWSARRVVYVCDCAGSLADSLADSEQAVWIQVQSERKPAAQTTPGWQPVPHTRVAASSSTIWNPELPPQMTSTGPLGRASRLR
jgi:hypothetical protein